MTPPPPPPANQVHGHAHADPDDTGGPEYQITKDLTEKTNRELRRDISKALGVRPHRSALSKFALNSLHAYLTGEFVCRPVYVYNHDQEPAPEFRQLINAILDLGYEKGPYGRTYNSAELEAIAAAVDQNPDQRPKPDYE